MSELVINAAVMSCCGQPRSECQCDTSPVLKDLKWYLIPGQEDIDYPDDDSDDSNSITTPPVSSTKPIPKIRSMADVDSGLSANEKRDILTPPGMVFNQVKTPKKDKKTPVKTGWEIPLPVIL